MAEKPLTEANMVIYKKEPIDVLVDLTKGLMFDAQGTLLPNAIQIFKESMNEDANDIPDSYILLRSQITDTTINFGDGESLIRSADCDVILITKGYADDTTDLHNINKKRIRQHLKDAGVVFQEFNLGYDDASKSTQHTFTIGVNYIG